MDGAAAATTPSTASGCTASSPLATCPGPSRRSTVESRSGTLGADGSDARRGLLDVLVPFVESRTTPLKRAVIGWSMGGYGALLLAETHADSFAAVVASAPAIWPSFGAAAPGAFDDAADFKANDVLHGATRLDRDAVRVDCGADDPFAGMARELRRRVPSLSGGIHDGFHDDATWRSYVPAQLDFPQARFAA
jgi:enterochelin esterase-like enzyme